MARTDTASRIVPATPSAVYRALTDPAVLAEWLPPEGMRGSFEHFEAREGGTYRMTLRYETPEHGVQGKTSDDSDVVEGRFVELVPNERVVQVVTFESDDPAFAGEMTMRWLLGPAPGGTSVRIVAENVPPGISAEDHAAGLASSLENLARYFAR
jgi:uncharacterized protein YndB with AHSA1/START domain